jgi:hypothetical protein
MEQLPTEISLLNKESIFKYIDEHYDIYHFQEPKETIIPPLLSMIEQTMDTQKLSLKEKGVLLYLKSGLAMMIDKGSPQLEKDLLKAVSLTRSRPIP